MHSTSSARKGRFLRSLAYSAAVIAIVAGILALIMIFILPKFDQMFLEMGLGEMPLITLILLGVAKTMVRFWYILILTPVIFFCLKYFFGKTPRFPC